MPIYEYECARCNQRFERLQRLSDPLLTACPNCGGAVHKMISSTAFSLKGGGWHAEGYGANSKTNAPPACPSGGSCAGCPSAAA